MTVYRGNCVGYCG